MRTTLDIDDDILEATKALARQTHRTAGAVISELARKALTSVSVSHHSKGVAKTVDGFVPFESRGDVVTNEQINRLREGEVRVVSF